MYYSVRSVIPLVFEQGGSSAPLPLVVVAVAAAPHLALCIVGRPFPLPSSLARYLSWGPSGLGAWI